MCPTQFTSGQIQIDFMVVQVALVSDIIQVFRCKMSNNHNSPDLVRQHVCDTFQRKKIAGAGYGFYSMTGSSAANHSSELPLITTLTWTCPQQL